MKKIFSFLAAVLFAGSMMAVNFTLSSADAVTVEGVTVTFAKGDGNNPPAWNTNGLRLYANNTVTVSSESAITAITFNWQKQGSKAFNTATASVGEYTHPAAEGEGKWTGSATSVTFTLGATGQLLLNTFTVTLGEGGEPSVEPGDEPVVEPEGPKNLGAKTIAEFLELKNTTDTCILTGVVSNIVNTTYGNFDLIDATDTVYVYGLLTPAGENKKFAELGVAENDTLTVLAIYNEYNGKPQVKNAIFVEVKKSTAPVVEPVNLGAKTIAEFLELKNTKDTCILTGVVSNIVNATYGNFDLIDATDTVYVYGLLTPAGESKKFAELNVAENDTLTVLAIYNEYNGKPQAKNAIFVEVKKSTAPVVEPVNLGAKTIAEFLELKNTKDTCILTGVVSNIVNTTYGNFDLIDATDTVYVYGLLTPAGDNKKFADLNVAENDTLTVLAIYNEYNGKPQAKNAIFVEVKKYVEPIEPVEGPTTCAEAAQAALSVENNNDLYNDGAEYTIEGYVTSIATAFNAQYGNISFWMADEANGGKVLEAYRAVCESAESAPAVGDKVAVTGKLTKYNTTPEFAAGCTYVILEKSAPAQNLGEKTIAEFLELKNMKDTCILTGVVDSIVNMTYGNLYLSDATSKVYVYGVLTAEGESKQFESLDVLAGDTLTILAIYNEYNGAPQVTNGIFVSVARAERPEPETIVIDVDYAEAGLIATQGIWQLNMYKDYDAETEVITYPDLYIGIAIQDETKIAGTYSIDDETLAYVGIDLGPNKSVEAVDASDLVITYLGEGVYHYELEFVGDDRNTYILDVELETPAYDLEDENFTDITLTDEVIDAVDHTTMVVKAVKVIKNGEVLIERNGVRYNVSGQLIR